MDALQRAVGAALGTEVVAAAAVHGGDVAAAYRMELADGRRVFAKTHANPPAGFFTTEAAGLRWLREPGVLPVPEVLAVSDGDDATPAHIEGEPTGEPSIDTAPHVKPQRDPGAAARAHLVLEWIEVGGSAPTTESNLGRSLAELHRAGAPCYGREDRRTTGSRGLPNEPCDRWAEFYATQRMAPLARLARDAGALPARAIAGLERLDEDRLAEVGGPAEPPARLHGDLWAGNRLVDRQGRSWLIDPAAHGGHREFDLAMMQLFGGFGPACFAAYEEVAPLAAGWPDRVALHQIAPLVVHAIKFAGGYVGSATEAIARYV